MAIYGHNFDVFIGKFFHGASKTVADLTAAAADTSEFAIELETGLLANTTALTTGDVFRVVQLNTDGAFKASPFIKFDDIRKGAVIEHGDASNGAGAIAEAEQISNIGYTDVNTGNSIEAVNSNRYTLRLNFINDSDLYSEQKDQYFFEYVSDASATQIEIANGIATKMGAMAFADGSTVGHDRAKVAVRRFSAATTEVDTANSTTLAWTRGTDQVVASAADHELVAGMYLRQTTGAGVPVYKIKAVNGANITLDMPSQEAGVADGDSKSLTAAVVEAAACGIKIVGLDAYYKAGLFPYHKVVFDFQLDGWGSTGSDTSTAAAKANTAGEAIADLEWFGLSKNSPGSGTWTGNGFPSVESYAEIKADPAQPYDLISFDYVLKGNDSNAISAGGPIKGTVVMALPGDADSLQDHLNDVVVNIDGITDILANS